MDSDPQLSFCCLMAPVSSAFLVCYVGMSVPTLRGGHREHTIDIWGPRNCSINVRFERVSVRSLQVMSTAWAVALGPPLI